MKCPTCAGNGKVEWTHPETGEVDLVECHDCHGFGFLPEKDMVDEMYVYGIDCRDGKCGM